MCKGWYIIFLGVFLSRSTSHHSITKRSLLFPRPSFLQFTYGLTVPLVLPRRSINFSMCAQNNYNLPYNTTLLKPKVIPARQYSRFYGMSRTKFYEYFSMYLNSVGLDGEACLLRTICEIAETSMHIKDEDTLLEKIIHFIFTPSLEMYSESDNQTTQNNLGFTDKLLLAEKKGKGNSQCDEVYSDCLISIVDLFSAKYNII